MESPEIIHFVTWAWSWSWTEKGKWTRALNNKGHFCRNN